MSQQFWVNVGQRHIGMIGLLLVRLVFVGLKQICKYNETFNIQYIIYHVHFRQVKTLNAGSLYISTHSSPGSFLTEKGRDCLPGFHLL